MEYRPVIGYEGYYEVSDTGLVKSVARTVPVRATPTRPAHHARFPSKLIKPQPRSDGRMHVRARLTKHGVTRTYFIHHLVLEAFVGPRPPGMEALHSNDIGNDNRVENLAWGTRIENRRDLVNNGLHWNAKKMYCKWKHEFTPENTYIRPDRPGRQCKACRRRNANRRRRS